MKRTKPPVGWEHVKKCFPVPNELLDFDLPAGAVAVYIYLLSCCSSSAARRVSEKRRRHLRTV